MENALGLTLLVVVVMLGLGHLAVHAPRQEFLVATAVVAAVGASMVVVAPVAAGLVLLASVGATKLATPAVPDTVPVEWS